MMLRNDYQRGLFNGDQGVVIRLRRSAPGPPACGAAFPPAPAGRPGRRRLRRAALELSFAMTVHKSQGSEHDQVALFLPDAPIPMLTRELLYTAVTRARHAVSSAARRRAGRRRRRQAAAVVGPGRKARPSG